MVSFRPTGSEKMYLIAGEGLSASTLENMLHDGDILMTLTAFTPLPGTIKTVKTVGGLEYYSPSMKELASWARTSVRSSEGKLSGDEEAEGAKG